MKETEADRYSASASKAIRALRVAIGVVRLYPDPLKQPGMDRALTEFRTLILPIRLAVTATGFEVSDATVRQDPQVQKIARALYSLGVEQLALRAVPEAEELVTLATLLDSAVEDVEAIGGPRPFLSSRGVTSITVNQRNLEVTATHPDTGQAHQSRSPLEQVAGQDDLVKELERLDDAEAALAHLEKFFEEGLRKGHDPVALQGGIADTIAELTEPRRISLMSSLLQRMDAPLPRAVIGQLSDGEISDSLVMLAKDADADTMIQFAAQIVSHSQGGRKELPVILARKLLSEGIATSKVVDVAGAMSGNRPLVIQDAEEEIDLAELRNESSSFDSEDFGVGVLTLRALFLVEEQNEDLEGLVLHAQDSIAGWAVDFPERAISILELLDEMRRSHPDPSKRPRFEEAFKDSVSAGLRNGLLKFDSDLRDDISRRFLQMTGPLSIPFLLERLGIEEDQTTRKMLIDTLADLARSDVSAVLPVVDDPRWFLVRNVASILGRTRRPEALAPLSRLSRHKDARVRREAIRSLTNLGDAAVSLVASALDDQDSTVRLEGIGALGAIDSLASSHHLAKFVDDSKRNIGERQRALKSLGALGSAEAKLILEAVAHRRWPPLPATLAIARYARSVLQGDVHRWSK